jgi:hypothetical protein
VFAVGLLVAVVPAVVAAQDAGTSPTGVVAWGDTSGGQTAVPAGLTNVIAVAAGQDHSLALRADGIVVAWGDDTFGEATVPADLPPVTAIAAGGNHSLALTVDGQVVGWGQNDTGQTTPPPGLSDVIAVAAGGLWSMALGADGTVVAWGDNLFGQTEVPAGLSGVTAIAAGVYHGLALLADGTVVMWGGYENLPRAVGPESVVPPGLAGVTAIAGGENHSVARLTDGTVVVWGAEGQVSAPVGLSNVKGIAAGWMHSLALRDDGTLVAWLATETPRPLSVEDRGQAVVPAGLSGVVALAAGRLHSLAIVEATLPTVTRDVADQTVMAGTPVTFSVEATGFPTASVQWEQSVDGTTFEAIAGATGWEYSFVAMQTDSGSNYRAVLSNPAGSVTTGSARLTVNLLPSTGFPVAGVAAIAFGLLATGTMLFGVRRRVDRVGVTGVR